MPEDLIVWAVLCTAIDTLTRKDLLAIAPGFAEATGVPLNLVDTGSVRQMRRTMVDYARQFKHDPANLKKMQDIAIAWIKKQLDEIGPIRI